MCDEYNGWTNYPTWACALWIDNEQWSYNAARKATDEVMRNDTIEYKYAAMRDWLEQFLEEHYTFEALIDYANELLSFLDHSLEPKVQLESATMLADMAGWAFGMIDDYSIVSHWIDEWESEHSNTEPDN